MITFIEYERTEFLCILHKLLARHPNTFREQTFKTVFLSTEGEENPPPFLLLQSVDMGHISSHFKGHAQAAVTQENTLEKQNQKLLGG